MQSSENKSPTGKTAQEHAAANQLQRLQVDLDETVLVRHEAYFDSAPSCVENDD